MSVTTTSVSVVINSGDEVLLAVDKRERSACSRILYNLAKLMNSSLFLFFLIC